MSALQPVEAPCVSSGKSTRLLETYNRWFEIAFADTHELREKAHRLRYQVYCCEHGYETPEEHPGRLEMDTYDCRSIQSLLLHRKTGAAVGTVRLVLYNPDDHSESFPIQKICSHHKLSRLNISKAAEVSRFAISKTMRKIAVEPSPATRIEDDESPKEEFGSMNCSIILGLMRATVQMSFLYGITDWFAVMEPTLLRMLSRFGIYFTPIGALVDYHGPRQPCHKNLNELLDTVRQEHPDLWEFVTASSSPRTEEKIAMSCSG